MSKIIEFNYDSYIDNLVEIIKSINLSKVTVLTGRNSGGKSLIRKQIATRLAKESGKNKVRIPHASQQLRTEVSPEHGAFSTFAHDLEWLATSKSTIDIIEKVFNVKEADYLIIDEPEIGLGEELQLGLADWLNSKIATYPTGVMIICHSRILVNNLKFDNFINLEGMSLEKWVNRTPVKISVEDFLEFSHEMFIKVRDRLKSK